MRKLMKPSVLVGAVILVVIIAAGWNYLAPSGHGKAGAGQDNASNIKIPKLSALGLKGKVVFRENCARCHGVNATGTDKGPPLIHDIYNPGHHADGAFYRAARQGSPQHHWNFGNMPPQPQVSNAEVASIIRYIREMQLANGIVYRQHRM